MIGKWKVDILQKPGQRQLHSFIGGISVFSLLGSNLQGAHCEERLRIEIVNLREQLDTRAEENGLCFIFFINIYYEIFL